MIGRDDPCVTCGKMTSGIVEVASCFVKDQREVLDAFAMCYRCQAMRQGKLHVYDEQLARLISWGTDPEMAARIMIKRVERE